MSHFREAVRHARTEQGLTQAEVAEQASLSQKIISDVERGTPVKRSTSLAICRVLGLGPPWPAVAFLESIAHTDARARKIPVEQAHAELAESLAAGIGPTGWKRVEDPGGWMVPAA